MVAITSTCRRCSGDGEWPVGDGMLTVDYMVRCQDCDGTGEVERQARLTIVPMTLTEAKTFVGQEHRHHPPPHAHKFSVGVEDEGGRLRGVAVAARPKAHMLPQYRTLEVIRLATDGTDNACSALYGAVARIGVEMGYKRHQILTYILDDEPGTSLKAAGWYFDGRTDGGSWDRPSRPRTDKAPTCPKQRWRAAKPPTDNGRSEP